MPRDFLTFNQQEDKIHREVSDKSDDKKVNFWFCYKIPIIIFSLLFICLIIIFYVMTSTSKPDYNIGLLTETSYPTDTIRQLEDYIALKGTDLNNDGKVIVKINPYVISLNYERSLNGEQLANSDKEVDMIDQMNSISGFNSDVENYNSIIYFVDDYSLKTQLDQINIFSYVDGSTPPSGATDYENLGEKWSDFSYLNSLELTHEDFNENGDTEVINEDDSFKPLYVCMRDVSSADNDYTQKYFNDSLELKNSLK